MRFGVERPELEGVGIFNTLCRGGEGGRAEEECVPLVKSRDIDAVAVDVLASGGDAGEMGKR